MNGRADDPPHRRRKADAAVAAISDAAVAAGAEAPAALTAALTIGQWSGPEPYDLGGGAFTAAVSLTVAAAAVEWTQSPQAVPEAADWHPCVALGAGRWRLGSADGGHRCGPGGGLPGIGLRWRPDAEAPAGARWSPVSQDRRSLDLPAAGRPFPPVLLLAPALAGSGKIGAEVRVAPGRWVGLPAPALDLQWCRDGKPIPGATAAAYVPVPADDRSALTCRVGARSGAGAAVAVTAALPVSYLAPARSGAPFEEIFDQGSGVQEVPAAGYFTGADLSYAVSGAGADIDAAGVLRIPTDTALSEMVTVTARNSGGAVASGFMVTVEAAEGAGLWLAADRKGRKPKDAPAARAAPAAAGPGGWRVLPALDRAEYQAFVREGLLSGDNGQYMLGAAQSEAAPDRIYTCQDSGGVWVSLDHGNSWNNLKNRGLLARFTTGIAVDPLDCRRVFVLTQGGGTDAEKFIGLQRSLDGGLSWQRVIANDVSPGRVTQSPINFAPTSKDPHLGYATRWYCIIQGHSRRKATGHPHALHLSDDGGATWRRVRALAAETYGSISHLVVSPTDPSVAYINSDAGFWRLEAADRAEGAITALSGAGGLPARGVRDRIYLGPDGRTLIVGVAGHGIFRSDDAGGRWSEIHADPDLGKLHVNPWDPERMIVSYAKGKQLKISTDGGRSFAGPQSVDTGPGGTDKGVISEGSCLVVWHPEKPERIWAHGGPRHWQTDDGGRNWRPANGYFNGKQHQNWFIDQMFDPADPDRFGYFMTDFGVGLTKNGGLWFDRGRMVTRKLDLIHGTVNGGALHPDPARRTILASVGKMNAGKLVLSQDDGATWRVASDGERRRQYVGFDLDDPRYAYQWRERSTDHGASWSAMPALPRGFAVSGMTLTAKDMAAGQAIFATDRDAGGRNSRILRSLDRGESWTRFADSPFDFGVDGMTGGGPCRAHPSDPDVFFTKGPNGWTIRKWMLGKKPGYADLNIMGGFPRGVPPDGMFAVMALALDRRHPEVMYVASSYDNVPYKFFRSTDGGAAWENLTEGFPGVFMRGLEVSPTTGEVFIGTPNGSRVLPAPYTTMSATGEIRPWEYRYLDRSY